jgi:hypothetical protein
MKDNLPQELESYINKKVDQLVRDKSASLIRQGDIYEDVNGELYCEIENTRRLIDELKNDHHLTINAVETEGYLRGLLYVKSLFDMYEVEKENDD